MIDVRRSGVYWAERSRPSLNSTLNAADVRIEGMGAASFLVVVVRPGDDHDAAIGKVQFVEQLVAQSIIDALDVAIQHRLARNFTIHSNSVYRYPSGGTRLVDEVSDRS